MLFVLAGNPRCFIRFINKWMGPWTSWKGIFPRSCQKLREIPHLVKLPNNRKSSWMKDAKSFTKFCKDEGEIKHWHLIHSNSRFWWMPTVCWYVCVRPRLTFLRYILPCLSTSSCETDGSAHFEFFLSQIVEIQNQRSTLPLNAS